MLKGKTAVITGGSRGIGAATAEMFSQNGADVAVIFKENEKKADEVCEMCRRSGVRAQAYRCDVSDFSSVKETVSRIKDDFGTIDILVNNAGINRDGLIGLMRESDFDDVIAANLKGTFNMMKACSKIFIRKRSGCVINVSSVAGIRGNAGQSNYAASKAGVIGLTKSAAKELASANVRCNAVAPGFIETDMTESLGERKDEWLCAIPLRRFGKPAEVAEAIIFLAEAEYINGEVICVDGGMGT